MKICFAGTFYFLALLNEADAYHSQIREFNLTASPEIITTPWVLTEVADALAAPRYRPLFIQLLQTITVQPGIRVVPADHALFLAGCDLYSGRLDKSWTLTDCISFVVMKNEQVLEALTGDRHFEQAGFIPLFA